MVEPKLHVSDDVQGLCSAFAAFVEKLAKSAIEKNGKFAIGLSGGSSATIVGNALSGKDLNWGKWHVFFCDERFVSLSGEIVDGNVPTMGNS